MSDIAGQLASASAVDQTHDFDYFRVINDAAGTLAKVGESYYDVLAAKNETTVSPQTVARTTPAAMTPGVTPPAAVLTGNLAAEKPDRTAVYILAGVAVAVVLVLVLRPGLVK